MTTPAQQNIIVVGGGYAGVTVVKQLIPKLDTTKYKIVLINSASFKIHRLAAARAIVTEYGDLENQALIPYDRLVTLPHTFAVGSVVSIQRPTGTQTSGLVTLDDGSEVPFAMLVLATGFSWPKVFDWPTTQKGVAEVLREHREKLQAANSAVVAGGGALGLEIAGEINHFYPNVEVTIVHKGRKLINNTYPDKFRDFLEQKVRKLGIKIIFEDVVVDEEPSADGWTTTAGGKRIRAGLIIQAVGCRPHTAFMRSLGDNVLNPHSGHVRVLPTLQLPDYPEIFAAGDIIDWAERKLRFKAELHGTVVAANILTFINGGVPKETYKGSFEAIMVTLGPNGGAFYLPLFWGWGLCLGGWVVSKIKAFTLQVPAARQFMGY